MKIFKKLPEKKLSRLMRVLLIVCLIISGTMFTSKHSFAAGTTSSPAPASACKAGFGISITGLPGRIDFTDASYSADTIINWNWTFGDGTTSNLQNPSHTYASSGSYNVCLAIQSSSGCTDTSCALISIGTTPGGTPLTGHCKAAFVFNTTNGFADLSESFTDITFSFSPIVSWNWSFGDGSTSALQNPVHLYSSAGMYNVCLATQDSSGCRDTACVNVYITNIAVNPGPVNPTGTPLTGHCKAAFVYTTTNGFADLSESFTDITFSFSPIVSWNWSFGDGSTSTSQNPVHLYSSAGMYNVCLATQDSSGCRDTACVNVYVTNIAVNPGPVNPTGTPLTGHCKAAFVYTTTNGFADLSESFTDITFSFSPIVSWNWSFGDGSTSTLQNPSHLYSSAGMYNVCLATQDSSGCRDTACVNVYVTVIKVSLTPVSTCGAIFDTHANGLVASFTDMSFTTDSIISWSWTFGDGNTSTLQNPSNTYSIGGVYNVCLTIQSASGCSDKLCYAVYVDTGLVYLVKPKDSHSNLSSNPSITDKSGEVKLKVYPNPANESTVISYSLPADGFAKVSVLDVLGNEIDVLASSEVIKGEHSITWNANNVPSGIYMVHIMANDNVVTKRVVVIK